LEHGISFDIAIVDYGIRAQSKEEVAYAQELAATHSLKCHLFCAPPIEKNFESSAREIRYGFFDELVSSHGYTTLLTAHHLGDRLEWFLMQLCKGAGCAELSGMQEVEKRPPYTLVRPALHLEKKELIAYLDKRDIRYFEDETNYDEAIKRNFFRHNYANPLLESYAEGIKSSFEYIDADRDELVGSVGVTVLGEFAYFRSTGSRRADVFAIDKHLKSMGYMLSSSERELLGQKETLVVGRKFVINQDARGLVFMAPFVKAVMTHEFKEECRKLKIEPKLRGYFSTHPEIFKLLKDIFL
jgi:tRNA(Ile)-lysidine synthase